MSNQSLPELSEVVHILNPLADKYFNLGIQLGIKSQQLKSIENNLQYSHDQLRCLTETIILWQDNDTSSECSWSALAKAVERMGGHNKLVKELKERDTQRTKSCPGAQTSAARHGQLSLVEARKKVDPTKDLVEPQRQLTKDLKVQAVTKGSEFLRPQRHDSTESADDTGYSSKNDSISGDSSGSEAECFEPVSGCGCFDDKPCSHLYKFCTDGCPNINPNRSAASREVPIVRRKLQLATQDLDEIEEDLEAYEERTKDIQKHFGRFVTDTCRSFKERHVDPQDLILLIRTSFPMMNERIKELNQKPCLGQIFNIVADHACSWFDYELLKEIINYFKDDGDKRRLQEYEHHFKEYAQERLPKGKKHIKIGVGAKQGCRQLVIKIDREWKEVTFNDLDKLRRTFASVLGIRRRDLYLADIREGCIMMTFMITDELARKLFPTRNCLTSSQVKSLKDEGVISLRCGKLIWRTSSNQNVCKVDTK